MEIQTQLQFHNQNQPIISHHFNLSRSTKPSTLKLSSAIRSFSYQNGIRIAGLSTRFKSLPQSVDPVASSKRALESGSVKEEAEELAVEDCEMKPEEWIELGFDEEGRSGKPCGEKKGVVEVMECLEDEAIYGSDPGRTPMDYNRRARVFDKSSRVFQALKQGETLV